VKNIDEIQLGMHEMDTWYFSPLPPEYKDCKVTTGGGGDSAGVVQLCRLVIMQHGLILCRTQLVHVSQVALEHVCDDTPTLTLVCYVSAPCMRAEAVLL
jgi:hypothetical protein